jgi:hypothetical protein
MKKIIENLKHEARRSWDGRIGEERAIKLENYLRNKLKEYSEKLNIPQDEILKSWESDRSYSAINYYQERNQPEIKGDKVKVFESVEEMNKSISDKKFRCPSCGGISSDPYECNSDKEMSKNKVCDWKVYGLLGDLGKGVYVYCKDKLKGETIFLPIAWE